MDTERAEGIVLRKHPVTESSLIVTWFTRELGKLRTMAKGARRPKGPFHGKIDLFYRDEIVFLRSRRSDLHLLHECFLESPHPKLRDSVPRMTAASYVAEVTDLATADEDPNAPLFDALSATLAALETERSMAPVVLWFELRLLSTSGWAPKWATQTATTRVLDSLAATSTGGAGRIRLPPTQISDARSLLWGLLDEQLGRPPRSRRLLVELL